jgi:hypothetical protein
MVWLDTPPRYLLYLMRLPPLGAAAAARRRKARLRLHQAPQLASRPLSYASVLAPDGLMACG